MRQVEMPIESSSALKNQTWSMAHVMFSQSVLFNEGTIKCSCKKHGKIANVPMAICWALDVNLLIDLALVINTASSVGGFNFKMTTRQSKTIDQKGPSIMKKAWNSIFFGPVISWRKSKENMTDSFMLKIENKQIGTKGHIEADEAAVHNP